MAIHIEEVFQNNGKWYGANTGKEYSKDQTEEKGCCRWSKPTYGAPDVLVAELEGPEISDNGCGKGK